MLGRQQATCDTVARELPLVHSAGEKQQHAGIACDVRDREAVRHAFTIVTGEAAGRRPRAGISPPATDASQPPMTVLVNAAGIAPDALVLRATEVHVQEVFQTNFFGAINVTQAALRIMLPRRRGQCVVTVLSWPENDTTPPLTLDQRMNR